MRKKTEAVTCPHCYFRILPSHSGICPSCGRNVNDLSGVDPDRAVMEIRDTAELPDFCLSCGDPTKRRVEIHHRQDLDKEPTLINFIAHGFVTASAPPYMSAEYGDTDGTTPTVILHVPQCDRCGKSGKPNPVHVDFDQMSMTFIVNRGFKEKAERSKKRSAD